MIKILDNDGVVNFERDEGNIRKNEIKHGIFYKDCEEVFLDEPIFLEDPKHSVR